MAVFLVDVKPESLLACLAMPELPEVEIVCRGLEREIPFGSVLESLQFFRRDLRYELPREALSELPGQKLLGVSRRGKSLVFSFERAFLLSHLGMTGGWLAGSETPLAKRYWQDRSKGFDHVHVEMTFSGGRKIFYRDARRFGYIKYFKESSELESLFVGQEPLLEDWSTENLWLKLSKQRRSLKVALMDQSLILGVGNIYANEVLFLAGISPLRLTSQLKKQDLARLRAHLKDLLEKAISFGGSSISDFHGPEGDEGHFQKQFFVYDREGDLCRVCSSTIQKKVLVGRSTFWCPRCQRK